MVDSEGDTREVAPADWGKVMIEEVLFRAARDVSEGGETGGRLAVTMVFDVTADLAARMIEVSTAGAVEPRIVTRIKL